MSCERCAHRLDVSLWGVWLATGCRIAQVLRAGCPSYQPIEESLK
jgi:hypothetical protein